VSGLVVRLRGLLLKVVEVILRLKSVLWRGWKGMMSGEGGGFADDVGPLFGGGFEEFGFGETVGLKHELADVGECGSGLGFDVALSGGGEQGVEDGIEVACGGDVGIEKLGDMPAGHSGALLVDEFSRVVIAEAHVLGGFGKGAVAAVSEGKNTQTAAVFGRFLVHRITPEKLNFGL
jgi:hypothetical protein